MGKVAVIIVNWNGCMDTIECLESLFRSTYDDFDVIICDNASSDDSLARIASWAAGELTSSPCCNPLLKSLSYPPVTKPIRTTRLSVSAMKTSVGLANAAGRLVLIDCEFNLGFAGANNTGLRYALASGARQYFWLLNNDTVVAPTALACQVKHMQEGRRIGILGSKLINYYDTESVQELGGSSYNRWIARGYGLGAFSDPRFDPELNSLGTAMDYVAGASMLVSKAFISEVGFMDEELFLYFEELDWALRAKGTFTLGYCSASIVYHKQGASTHREGKCLPSLVADYFSTRNKLIITRTYFPYCLPTVVLWLLLRAARRFLQGAAINCWAILRILFRRQQSVQECLAWLLSASIHPD